MDYDDDDYVYQNQPMQYAPAQNTYNPYQGQAPPPQQQFNAARPPLVNMATAPDGSHVHPTSTTNVNNNNTYFAGASQPLNAIPTNQNVVLGGKAGSAGHYAHTSPNVSASYAAPAPAPVAAAGGSNRHLNISQSSWQTASTSRAATPSAPQPAHSMPVPELPSYQFHHQTPSGSQPQSLFRFDNSPNRLGTPSQIASGSRRESLPQTPTLNTSMDGQAPQRHSSSFLGAVSTPPQLLLQPKLSPSRSPSAPQQQQQQQQTPSSLQSTPSRAAMGMPYQTPLRPIRPRGNAHGIVLRHQVPPDALPQPKPVVLPANGPALRPLLLLLPAVQEKLRDITPSPANYFDDVVQRVMLSLQDWISETGGEVRFFTFHPKKNETSFVCVAGMYLRALQRIVGNNMDRCMVFVRNGLVSFRDVKQPVVAVETVQTVCGAEYTTVFSCSVNEVCILDCAIGVAPPYFFINSRMS